MGWFSSKSNSYFDSSWDKNVAPTASGEDVYAVRYGSRELVGSVPNYSGIMRCRWWNIPGKGDIIFVTCKDGEAFYIYENGEVERH